MESKPISVVPVEFRFTRGSYLRSDKLFCYFHIPNLSECQPETGDWIGIYKVGWTSYKEFIVRRFITLESIEKCRVSKLDYGTLCFEPCELPKELGCSYQFVYVTKGNVVRGTSKPFVFETIPSCHVKDELFYPSLVDMLLGQERFMDEMMIPKRSESCLETDYEILRRPEIMDKYHRFVPKTVCESVVKPTEYIHDDISTLIQKCLTMKPIAEDRDKEYKRVQELLTENIKLRLSLDCKNEEIVELKREKEELVMCNTDLLSKLGICESEIHKVTIEREQCISKVMEVLRVMFEGYPSHFDKIINAERKLDMLERERECLLEKMAEIKTKESLLPFFEGIECGKHYEVPSWTERTECGVTGTVKCEQVPKTFCGDVHTEVIKKQIVPTVPVTTKVTEVCPKIEKPTVCIKKIDEPVKVKSIGEHINEYIAKTINKPVETIVKPCEKVKYGEIPRTLIKDVKPVECKVSVPECKVTVPECKVTFPERKVGVEHERILKEHKPRLWKEWLLEECRPMTRTEDTFKMPCSPSMEHIICPVCGVAVSKESHYEFELHVNSHFTD